MNRLIRILALAVTCVALAVPQMEAQHTNTNRGRNGGNSRSTTTQQQQRQTGSQSNNSRAGNNSNRGNNRQTQAAHTNNGNSHGNPGNYRPSGTTNNGGTNNNGTRPGGANNNGVGNYRPGGTTNNGGINHGTRPNNPGNGSNNRPGGTINNGGNNPGAHPVNPGNGNNYRPGVSTNPGHGAIGVQPGAVRPPRVAPPVRVNRPLVQHGWRAPVPPPSWRPRAHAPLLSSIIGITFGTAIGLSIDMLLNSGYTVDGYGTNVVYLRDVREANYMWPDATFYYGPDGGFDRSEFLYSTPYPDMMRYNSLYNTFVSTYGAPLNVINGAATWFAPNKGYITLQYNQQQSLGGQMRFFTTLTFGL